MGDESDVGVGRTLDEEEYCNLSDDAEIGKYICPGCRVNLAIDPYMPSFCSRCIYAGKAKLL